MKLIGLLGGTSWPSTTLYYERLNRMAGKRLGGFHSARIVLYSLDYEAIKSRYHDGWSEIPPLLERELAILRGMGPDCILLCNNTLHKAYDRIPAIQPEIPFFHIVDLTVAHAREQGFARLLFLATRFTMEDDFFTGRLREAGLDVIVPNAEERAEVQEIQTQLAAGTADPRQRAYFRNLIACYPQCQAVVLACTELPLAIDAASAGKPVIDTIELQCRAAV